MGEKVGIHSELTGIRGRLERGRKFSVLMLTDQEPPDAKSRMRSLKPSAIARSEFFILPEELISLEERIAITRSLLFTKGKDFTKHPDYDIWLLNEERTFEEFETLYWHFHNGWETLADKHEPSSDKLGGYRLELYTRDRSEDASVNIFFDFKGKFELDIHFPYKEDPMRNEFLYKSTRLPLQQMTQEESSIVQYYLLQFIKQSK